ncbi:threonine dehydratase [Rhabdaerophilum calidifontis]|uniref:threonine dehydratase n=1 Tax=Rhabdaerophilum calidifontis TaxID=2604328 RepID=UPI00123B9A47|nr:threonine dehydratase [Rhabdaerophilum calidifontis]
MFTLPELRAAAEIVHAAMPPTPAYAWPLLGERLGCTIIVKHENHTPTGAFKVRGGLVYLDRLRRERPHVPGIVSATRGNHGQSLAYAGRRHGVAVTILVPHGNSTEKNAAMRAFGADLIEHGADFQEAREEAGRLAQERGLEMVPSFHRDLVLGVATYALELLTAHPDLARLYVPIGQGSGICGSILARDLLGAKTEIVGVQSAGAPAYALSFAAGHPVSTATAETFADGVATRVPDPEALAIIRRGAARIVQVSDDEIAAAIRAYWTDTHNLAEGAGAAPLAAALQERMANAGQRIGVILCGGNIDLALFRRRVLDEPVAVAAQ